jgi:hypothetical protein
MCLAHVGHLDEARAQLGQDLQRVVISEDTPIRILACLLEAAVLLEEREVADRLLPLLGDVTAYAYPLTNVARVVGEAAALLGDRAGARAAYQHSLDWATRIRYRPEVALTRLALAELALGEVRASPQPGTGNEELEAGLAHLDFAIAELRAMKMQPALERALRLKGLPPA